MKKYILLLVSVSTLFSCIINPVPIAEKPPEKINILSKIKPKMEYPYDIEVTKDGKYIYFKNWYNYPQISDYSSEERKIKDIEKITKRKVIYKLDVETKKIELFKIGDDPLIYNELGDEMEIDNDGNLYVNLTNRYINNFYYRDRTKKSFIYKISSNGSITQKYNVFQPDNEDYVSIGIDYAPTGDPSSPSFLSFEGPKNLVLENDKLYYNMAMPQIGNTFSLVKEIDLKTNNISDIYKIKGEDFFINKNTILILLNNLDFFDRKQKNEIESFDKKYAISISIPKSQYSIYRKNYFKVYSYFKSDSKENIYNNFIDSISKYNVNNKTVEIIGTGQNGYKDGNSNEATFDYPSGLSIDANDNIYVADTGNNAIRKITPDGIVSTLYKDKL